jgi:hypothetical protein
LILAAAGAALVTVSAAAEPDPSEEVYSPAVVAKLGEVEVRSGVLNGGAAAGDWQTKIEAGYGLTDWWRPALVGEWERGGGGAEFSASAVENLFDVTATRTWPVRLGFYVEYEWAKDGPNQVEMKLLMQRQRGPLDLRLNLIAARSLGAAPQNRWRYGYAAQASYAFNDDFALGVQGFGDAGDDGALSLDEAAHYWGPYAQIEAAHFRNGELELQAGYLAGFGDAQANGVLRVKLEYEFGGRDSDD